MSSPDPGPDWARAEADQLADVQRDRYQGRIAQLEGQLLAVHAELNRLEADAAGDSSFADGVRYTVGRIRPQVSPLRSGGANVMREQYAAVIEEELEQFFRDHPEEPRNSPWVHGMKDAAAAVRAAPDAPEPASEERR